MKAFTLVYTEEVTSAIKKKARGAIAVFAVCTAGFVAFCALFCVLAGKELFNVYACAAFNVAATLAYLWYCYLFFTVLFVSPRRDMRFVKSLQSALPAAVTARFCGTDGNGAGIFDGAVKPLNCAVGFSAFAQGSTYELKTVQGNIVEFREVSDE